MSSNVVVRLGLGVLILSISVVGGSRGAESEETTPSASQPQPRYTVLCRCVDENGDTSIGPKLTFLSDGEKRRVFDRSQSPFVTGVIPVDGTIRTALQPVIHVVDEGTSIEVAIFGQQHGGVTVDVTVERSSIADVGTKACGPTVEIGPGVVEGTTVQTVRVDTEKKRVIEFVSFGETLVVPLGAKGSKGTLPRVELVVNPKEEVSSNWFSRTGEGAGTPADGERKAVFDVILSTGAARVSCERVSRWRKLRGRALYDDLGPLRQFGDLAELYFTYCPHRFGSVDALSLLASTIRHPARVQRLEEVLLGYDLGYSVELWDSPSLVQNVELLGRLPELWSLVVVTNRLDYRLAHALTKVNVLSHLEVCHTAGQDPGADPYALPPKPGIDGEREAAATEPSGPQLQWNVVHEPPGHAALVAQAGFDVDEAEAAIASLSALPPDVQEVLSVLIVAYEEDGEQAQQAEAAMEQALPSARIDTFVFSGLRP